MVYDKEALEEYLAHHQTKGSHWGVRHGPPYPLPSSKMTKMQKRFNKELLKQKEKLEKKKAKLEEKESRKKAKAEYKESKKRHGKKKVADENVELTAEQKADALKYNRVSEIYKHRSEFSSNELNDAINRFEKETKLREYAMSTVKTRWDQMESMAKKMDKISTFAGSATKLYNSVAPGINAAAGTKLKKLEFASNENKKKN